MKRELAKYKRQLQNKDNLYDQAQLTSVILDETQEVVEFNEEENIDYETLFAILRKNFDNPRAMNCFVFYDIEDNKLRLQIAKYLLRKGCQRIQRSVYLANINKRIYEEITETIKELEEVFSENDSIFFVPIGEYHLAEMIMVGKDVDMAFSRSSQHVIFI